MAHVSTHNMSARGAPVQQNTFLDDNSTSSSDSEDADMSRSVHDSGYVSRFATPARMNESSISGIGVHEAMI